MEFDAATGTYTALGDTKTAMVETTWRLIVDTDALTTTPQGTIVHRRPRRTGPRRAIRLGRHPATD